MCFGMSTFNLCCSSFLVEQFFNPINCPMVMFVYIYYIYIIEKLPFLLDHNNGHLWVEIYIYIFCPIKLWINSTEELFVSWCITVHDAVSSARHDMIKKYQGVIMDTDNTQLILPHQYTCHIATPQTMPNLNQASITKQPIAVSVIYFY